MLDVHTHCHQRRHRGGNWEKHSGPTYAAAGMKVDPDVTPEQYDAAMAEGGVDLALVFGVRATVAGIATPNDFVEDFCAQTKTPTVGFMALDLNDEDLFEQLEDGIARGLRGVKLYAVLAMFDARDPKHDKFFRAATDAGLIILWHLGATPVPEGSLALSHPLIVDDVARRHPNLVQIIAHLGHPWQRESIITIRKNKRVFADVSAQGSRPLEGYLALTRAQEWGVVEKLLFGSDFPLWTPAAAKASLLALAARDMGGLPRIETSTLDWILEGDHRTALGLTG
ncbi:amidohydrolase family protein [Nakamurella lactea]|uniref:amidohydrolase family protein n=1 Tax=Nakamurella lactea TaxID=459515 RepID=UPI00042041C2|nr:amidohydrolase family protein [Nakamurella lactea]